MDDYQISLKNVSKRYFRLDLRALLFHGRRGILARPAALAGISLNIREGERVGVIGHNGAGKSTLLKIIAGLAAPSSGAVRVQGRVNCVLTLGVSLREDLTGRENICLDGELAGRTDNDIRAVMEEIIDFAELGEFIDRPVRTYSSGMKARLAFSLITTIRPEILLIDEALSAGDAAFNLKASRRIKEICAQGKILVLVSHSLPAIADMCDRCLWLDHGRLIMDGPPEEVARAYLAEVEKRENERLKARWNRRLREESLVPGYVLTDLAAVDEAGRPRAQFPVGDGPRVSFTLRAADPSAYDGYAAVLSLTRTDGLHVAESLAEDVLSRNAPPHSARVCLADLTPLRLGKQVYEVRARLLGGPERTPLAEAATIFEITNAEYPHENPVAWIPAEWSFPIPEDAPWASSGTVAGAPGKLP
ncbi:MAG: ATP-binding cassette domain-containing protein [Deltaproteobacteria bacterium]|nr:ATP-binding cassette domain-containing protein [Deltaproteobacteria bacterium]